MTLQQAAKLKDKSISWLNVNNIVQCINFNEYIIYYEEYYI